MKFEVKSWFSGAKKVSKQKPENTTKQDWKEARCSSTDNNHYFYMEFIDEIGEIIEVQDVCRFYDLTRFFYKGYCCVIEAKNFNKIN